MSARLMSPRARDCAARAIVAMLAFLMQADAQIGQSASAAARRWGEPRSGTLCPAGSGRLSYEKNGIAVECAFIEGVCRQALYRSAALDYAMVNSILAMNGSDRDWTVHMPDETDPHDWAPRHWIRADENVEAEMVAGTLTVWDVRWRQRLDELAIHDAVPNPGDLLALPDPEKEDTKRRGAAVPRARARPPSEIPAKGDTKAEVLRLLGRPTGTMSSGGREVLMYVWGNIWIVNGVVTVVELPR